MYKVANRSVKELEELFRATAAKAGFSEAIVEKDFWVCLMLDYLFHRCRYKDSFTFKGGTSLSKAWGVIERFSEDIDLILDWRTLGYSKDEPNESRSKNKQDKLNKEARFRRKIAPSRLMRQKSTRACSSKKIPSCEPLRQSEPSGRKLPYSTR